MASLVWIMSDGTRRIGDFNMKPFLTAHFQMPEAGKVLFVPFPKLRTMAIQVKHTTRPLLQQCPPDASVLLIQMFFITTMSS